MVIGVVTDLYKLHIDGRFFRAIFGENDNLGQSMELTPKLIETRLVDAYSAYILLL